jgi:dUTP pyrophosphatase
MIIFARSCSTQPVLYQSMKVRIVNQSKHDLPEYATSSSAGMDLRANLDSPIQLKPLQRAMVPTGIFIELPVGFEAQVRPRSGLAAKHGITVLNTPGTIDADYRGEVKVILVNLSEDTFEVNDGERIAQMIIAAHQQAEWERVETLNETERGAGGFGHTGSH